MQTSPTAKGDSVLMNIMYDPSPAPLKYNAFLEIVSKKADLSAASTSTTEISCFGAL